MRRDRFDFIAPYIPKVASVNRWTDVAIDCYLRGGVCKSCFYSTILESKKCQMKFTVIKLVKELGKPKDYMIKQKGETESGKK